MLEIVHDLATGMASPQGVISDPVIGRALSEKGAACADQIPLRESRRSRR